MKVSLILLSAGFIHYPGWVDPSERVEAIIDRGPILELIVRCPVGTAIMTYSKVERLYCTPQLACDPRLDVAHADSCD